jgi:hypothetical protein
MWPEPVVDSRQGQQMAPATAPTIAPGESAPRPTPAKRVVQGLNVNIENPQGSLRTGTGDNGMPWQVHMPADYGEIEGTRGADGSPVDAYVGPHPESRRAFVIDQYDPQGNFDEHKVVLAARTAKDATAIYDAGFSDGSGPARRGAITEVPVTRLKAWLKDADTTEPFAGSEHAAPPAPKEAPVRRPMDIIEFLARDGGIKDEGGDLRAMDLHKKFVPGAGMLVRRTGGKGLDYARESAEQAGYLPEGSTTADLLDAIDQTHRGKPCSRTRMSATSSPGRISSRRSVRHRRLPAVVRRPERSTPISSGTSSSRARKVIARKLSEQAAPRQA